MIRAEFTSLLAAVRRGESGRSLIVFGSSSFFVAFPDVEAEDLGVILTKDSDILLDPDDIECRRILDASFGADSAYARAGIHADFVDLRISQSFPPGWRERLVAVADLDRVFALEPHDAAAAKLLATAASRLDRRMGRSVIDRGLKDIAVVSRLATLGMLNLEEVRRRLLSYDDLPPALMVEVFQAFREAGGQSS